MGVAVFIVANDFTALAVALPAIEKQFDTDVGTVQWVINAYALTFGVLIVVGGRLADIFGRKRVFILGAAIFAVFSVLGGVAQDTAWLIACRTLMGIGGAMMWPAILGMTFAALPESRAGLAGGLILGAAGIGNAVGPMFGGVLRTRSAGAGSSSSTSRSRRSACSRRGLRSIRRSRSRRIGGSTTAASRRSRSGSSRCSSRSTR